MARTASDLFREGYRVEPSVNGFRMWRGAGGYYDINLMKRRCQCVQFGRFRFCCHMDNLREMCLLQMEELLTVRARYIDEQKAIVAQIRRGGLNYRDAAELEKQAQELNNQDWLLRERMVDMRHQMFAMGMFAAVEELEGIAA